MSVKGKLALITGSSGGLGLSMAQALAQAGCRIVLHGVESAEEVRSSRQELESAHGVEVDYLQADLANPDTIARMFDDVSRRHGGVDILINNAVTRHFSPAESFPVECWDKALAVNLSAAFHTIRLSLPGMRKSGWGRIFNMTSVYGIKAVTNRIDYVTTKAALIAMSRVIALETINQGITCNAICPGAVLTPTSDARILELMARTGLERKDATQAFLAGKQPTQKFVDPAHVAELVVFLCGAAGSDITGAMLPVEGGWLAS